MTATNGLQAFQIAKEKNFDLIIMDLNMPVMGGIEALIKIKKHYKEINILSVENSQLPYMVALSASDLDNKL